MAKKKEMSAERKGLAYEAFVAVAVEKAFGSAPEIGTKLKGVIADQDVIWPSAIKPQVVISVTHWGSHEAAKMKFWRVHEDLFEVLGASENVAFVSVVFDRNEGSDQNLCQLLDHVTMGRGISDVNCAVIEKLQYRVSTEANLREFGVGKEVMVERTRNKCASDPEFAKEILSLGKAIEACVSRKSNDRNIADLVRKASLTRSAAFRSPRNCETYFKPALIALIDAGPACLAALDQKTGFDELPKLDLVDLMRAGLVRERSDSLIGELEGTELFEQLRKQGIAWCKQVLTILRQTTADKSHALYAYHDHIADVTDSSGCKERVDKLMNCATSRDVYDLLSNPGAEMNRCWPIDYALAIQRSITPAKEYGVQKLSLAAGIPYEGAPVSCPLPRFVSGQKDKLSKLELKQLASVIFDLKRGWDLVAASSRTVQIDRKITLMKKLSVLDVVLEYFLKSMIANDVTMSPFIARHPLSAKVGNAIAGSTEFNFRLSTKTKSAFIFVAASYEATHKHKELSGRLRAARAAGWVREDDLCLILADGNLFSDSSASERASMLRSAGWRGAYYLDEISFISQSLREHFGKSVRELVVA